MQRGRGLSIAPKMVRRLEGQRANGPATRASSTRSATGMGMVGSVNGAHTLTNTRLRDASRSADEVGVGGHDCEHMAGRDGCERVSSRGRWLPVRTFPCAGSALPATAEAVSSAPASRSAVPMRPRLLLECTRPLFTAAVTEAEYLRAAR